MPREACAPIYTVYILLTPRWYTVALGASTAHDADSWGVVGVTIGGVFVVCGRCYCIAVKRKVRLYLVRTTAFFLVCERVVESVKVLTRFFFELNTVDTFHVEYPVLHQFSRQMLPFFVILF